MQNILTSRYLFSILVMTLISLAVAAPPQECTQPDCKGTCSLSPCVQRCNVTDCRTSISCSNSFYCGTFCLNGGCPEMSCTTQGKTCQVVCLANGGCKDMRSRAVEQSRLDCNSGSCNMECSNYDSLCTAYCGKGNCNLKCKAKICKFSCDYGNCSVTGGLGTKVIEFNTTAGSNSRVTCAVGSSCGTAGCDAKNNCVVYAKNPFNETSMPDPYRPGGASYTTPSAWLLFITAVVVISSRL